MKTKINILIMLLSMIVIFTGCKKDDDDDGIQGSSIGFGPTSVSVLDKDIIFTVSTSNSSITETKVYKYKTYNSDDDSIDFSMKDLGYASSDGKIATVVDTLALTEVGYYAELTVITPVSGGNASEDFTVSMIYPLSIDNPESIPHNGDTTKIYFSGTEICSPIDQIIVSKRLNNGGWENITSPELGSFSDSVYFIGNDYNLGDSISFKVKISTANGSVEDMVKAKVTPAGFKNISNEMVLGAEVIEGIDLVNSEYVNVGTDTTDVYFINDPLVSVGLKSDNGTLFVLSDEAQWDLNDIITIEQKFADGPQVSEINVNIGDYIIYKTKRIVDQEEVGHYGVINVNDVLLTLNGTNDFLKFKYKY